jgi:hypothetical protein
MGIKKMKKIKWFSVDQMILHQQQVYLRYVVPSPLNSIHLSILWQQDGLSNWSAFKTFHGVTFGKPSLGIFLNQTPINKKEPKCFFCPNYGD